MNNIIRQSSRLLSATLFAMLTMLLCHGTMKALALGLTDPSTNPSPAAVPVPQGLVGWWRGEGTDVDVPSDPSGMGTNAVTYGPGKVGNGFSFDGVNTTLYAIASPVLNIGSNQNFSIEGWIQTQPNPDNIRGIAIIAEKTAMPLPGISAGWQLYMENGLLSVKLMQRSTLEENHWTASGPDLRDGQFHHVAAVLDRNSANGGKLYVDGSPVLTFDATHQSGDLYTEGHLLIGCANYTYNAIFEGIIDELSLYNRALTDSEILSVYNAAGSGKILTPSIITHPANQTVNEGQAAMFNVDGVGCLPLSYQWSFNGTNIAGATNSSLSLNKVQLADAGVYNVVISNNSGSITSSNAVLTINAPPPASVPAPAGMVAWWKGESNVVDAISGASGFVTNGAGYGPGKVGTGMSFDGVYGRVCIPASPALNFGSNQNFSVEAWIQAQDNPGNYDGRAVIVDKSDTLGPSWTLGWQFYLEYGKLAFKMMHGSAAEQHHWAATGPYLCDGKFHHVAATVDRSSTNGGRLYVDGAPVMTFDPTLEPDNLSSIGMLLIGNGSDPDIHDYFNGIIDEVSLYDRALTDADVLSVYSAGSSGKCLAPAAPFISIQPADQSVKAGDDAVFDVAASGSMPLTYQWNINGTNIAGATNSSFTVANAQLSDAGDYTVVISNHIGSITSSNAVLTVSAPTPTAVQAPDGIIGWWKGEYNGVDTVSHMEGGVASGANYANGKVGIGFALDGVSGQALLPNVPIQEFGSNQNFSVEAWIQAQPNPLDDSGIAMIADKTTPAYDPGKPVGWQFYLENGRLGIKLKQRSTPEENHWVSSGPDLRDGQFHHVAAVLDRKSANGGRLYVDGKSVLTFDATQESGDLSTGALLSVGGPSDLGNHCYYKGIIDEVTLYKRALTDAEILSVYMAGGSGKYMAPVAPFISMQPVDQLVKTWETAVFNVLVGGSEPFSYQWSLNGTNIPGANGSQLVLTNIQFADAGKYAVVITNSAGSVTSSIAVLSLSSSYQAPPGLVGWWRGESNVLDNVSLTIGYATNGAGYGPGKVGSGFSLDGINDQAIIPNAPTLNFGSNQNFSVEAWIQAQATPGNYAGVAEIVSKAFTPDGNESVGWSLFLSQGNLGFLMSQAPMSGFNSSIWTTSGPNLQDGVLHHVGVTVDRASSSGGKVYVDGALIMTFDPTQESGDLSTTGPLYVGCHDNPTMNCYFKGVIDEVSLYNRALTSEEIRSVFQDGTNGKTVNPFGPVITAQPANRRVPQGMNASIDVGVAGTPPLSYQWSFNGTNIAGATNNSLVLSNVQVADAGEYGVVISNALGSTTSSNAVLTVILPQLAPQGLVGWWRGESNVVDEFSGLIGYETNGAGYGPGEVGSGFAFDGINDQVIIPNCPVLNFGSNQNFSVEAWIQAQATPGNFVGVAEIVSKAYTPESSQSVGWSLFLSQGNLGFLMSQAPMSGLNSSIWTSAGPNLQDGLFHHVGVTVDRASSSGGKVYVDGALIMTFDPTQESGDLSTTGPLYIGCHDNPTVNCNFKGIIDEVSIYNRALTSNEITAVNLAGQAGKAVEPSAPILVRQPADQRIVCGNDVTLEVGAGGTQPLAYQWRCNGEDITGGTNYSLVLTNVQFAQSGLYSVKVSNGLGSVVSSNALLGVEYPPANVRVASVSGSPSAPITVPILLMANGNENAVSFSVNFDPAILRIADVVAGSGAPGGLLFVNTNLIGSGSLGLIMALPADVVFSPGPQEIVQLVFNAASVTTPVTTFVTLGDLPTASELSDVDVNTLAALYENGTVTIAAAQFEGDVTPHPDGNQTVTMMDWVLEGYYVAGLNHPASTSEFQRADCAPQSTRGDGVISVIDWVQVGRYAIGMDPFMPVGGPLAEANPMDPFETFPDISTPAASSGCEVKMLEKDFVQGQIGTVSVVMEAQGTENAVGLSLVFDSAGLKFVNASLGADASGALLNVNTNDASSGLIGVALAHSPGHTFGIGTREILKLSFQVATFAAPGRSSFTFINMPVTCEVAGVDARPVITTFTQGAVEINASEPALQIRRLNGQVVLSWPAWATNYSLQVFEYSSTNTGWNNSTAIPILINRESVVVLPASAQKELYRLIKVGAATPSGSGTTTTTPGH